MKKRKNIIPKKKLKKIRFNYLLTKKKNNDKRKKLFE